MARLRRLRAEHQDDQFAICRPIHLAQGTIRDAATRIAQIEADLTRRTPTRGDPFRMTVGDRTHTERKTAGASLLSRIRIAGKEKREGRSVLGAIGGFAIGMQVERPGREKGSVWVSVWLVRAGHEQSVELNEDLTPLGVISRLEYMLDRFEADLTDYRRQLTDAEQRLPVCRSRRGDAFAFEGELMAKEEELSTLEASLASTAVLSLDGDIASEQAQAA